MTPAEEIDWAGQSGEKYHYGIYPIDTQMKPEPGNYIFAREFPAGNWVPIYIGETSDLSERFDHHHAMPCIRQNGATVIHAHTSSEDEDERIRKAEESDLIARWHPICNG